MRTIVAGNWKMHKDKAEALALLSELVKANAGQPAGVEVVVSPPYPFLDLAVNAVKGSGIQVAAQNCHAAASGAFTGEVSVLMLKSLGVTHCIVGHSERRQYFGETDAQVAEKLRTLLFHGLAPIYCCGERREEREAGRHFHVVEAQLNEALAGLTADELERCIVAYEPVWAIGTGLNATAQQAQDMHAFIRGLLADRGAASVPVLYGGSCKPDNAAELFACPDVNGGLIGGASLDASQFSALIRIARERKA
ncbi:MAG: triose-phosphate isomerase [Flavobacteriales bacterium]|nr:triose-phosphate isomerase [Flavobacteriales bacterium]